VESMVACFIIHGTDCREIVNLKQRILCYKREIWGLDNINIIIIHNKHNPTRGIKI